MSSPFSRFRGLLSLALMVMAGSCHSSTGPGRIAQAQLDSAKHRWQTRGIVSYEYVIRHLCFCGYANVAIRVRVRNGAVESQTIVDTGEPLPMSVGPGAQTIDGRFQVIADAISQHAHSIQATYDDLLGFPRAVFIDYLANAADEEYGFTVDSFAALE